MTRLCSFQPCGSVTAIQPLSAPVLIAIASELLEPRELLERGQQGDHGARPVADGEWRVAMSVDSSRVFRWPGRSRWPAQWGSEWPERLPVLRPLTAPALPIA
jgi:hypothetical protein